MSTIYMAVPCYGGMMTARCAMSILRTFMVASANGRPIQLIYNEGESLIQRGRNNLVHDFLKASTSDDDKLLFVDSDLEFDPKWPFMLDSTGYDLCGLAYPRKRMEWDDMKGSDDPQKDSASYFIAPEGTPGEKIGVEQGCIPVRWLGTGFMLISKRCIQDMMASYPETAYISDSYGSQQEVVHALFDCVIDPKDGIYLSEDYTFCKRWKDIGGRVMMGLWGSPSHIGTHVFKGNLDKLVRAV